MFVQAGHSGCRLELLVKDGQSIVRKSTDSLSYAPRLRRQAQKQTEFAQQTEVPGVSAPIVLQMNDTGRGFSFTMPFVAGLDGVTFIQRSSRGEVDALTKRLFALIEHNLAQSDWQSFPQKVFIEKLFEIEGKLQANILFSAEQVSTVMRWVRDLLANLEFHEKLPVGRCHGDLIFANIHAMQKGEELTLIDFLDCFVESPLQDMVKLRQDTMYMWSSLLYRGSLDRVRHGIMMQYMDAVLDAHFQKHAFYREYYVIFQQVNLMRVLSYAERPDIVQHILKSLEENFTKRIEYAK